MNALIQAAAELQAVCIQHDWRFCFIGGLAVQRWGEPRETVDVDLTLLTGFADEDLPFEELAVSRASVFIYPPDLPLRTCSAEYLIVLKAFADRPKDWLDIDGIIIRQSRHLDWAYVRAQLAPLAELKDAPELVDKLDQRRIDLQD